MCNKVNKLLLIGPLPPPMAGPEVVTSNLLESFDLNDTFDVYLINTSFRKENSEKGKIGIRIFIAYIVYIAKLLQTIIFVRPDLVFYLPTSATLVGWVRDGSTIFLSKLLGRRVILLMQGGHFRFFYDHSNGFVRAILSFLLNRCEKIFVQAECLKFQFNEVVPSNKIAVFYNFISKEFSDNFDAVDRENNGDINVLFVGHLTTAKGYCDLLKILPKLDGVRYTIIGSKGNARNVKFNQHTSDPLIYEDPEKIFQDYIGKNNLEGSVIFLGGNVNGKEKIQAFKEADIFALPSYSEGFSTAIVEGMTAGLPIIATSVGAAPEIIEDGVNGYIVNPGDLSALQMRIQELSNNKELRLNMGRHNLLLSKEKFSTDNVIKNLKVELQAIIARN